MYFYIYVAPTHLINTISSTGTVYRRIRTSRRMVVKGNVPGDACIPSSRDIAPNP